MADPTVVANDLLFVMADDARSPSTFWENVCRPPRVGPFTRLDERPAVLVWPRHRRRLLGLAQRRNGITPR